MAHLETEAFDYQQTSDSVTGNVIVVRDTTKLLGGIKRLLFGDIGVHNTIFPDMLIARQMVESPLDRQKLANTISGQNLLYRLIPELEEVDSVVQDFWKQKGYRIPALICSQQLAGAGTKASGIDVHTDYPRKVELPLAGPLFMSIGISGRAKFYAETAAADHTCDTGEIDLAQWKAWTNSKDDAEPEDLASSCIQEAGDIVMITNHPRQTFHAVVTDPQAEVGRLAAMYEYTVNEL